MSDLKILVVVGPGALTSRFHSLLIHVLVTMRITQVLVTSKRCSLFIQSSKSIDSSSGALAMRTLSSQILRYTAWYSSLIPLSLVSKLM